MEPMSHLHDNVRSLICPRVGRSRRHAGVAKSIRLEPRSRPRRVRRTIPFWLAALTLSIVIVIAFAIALRSGDDVAGRLAPGWPWW
jgi:hypothetical protein